MGSSTPSTPRVSIIVRTRNRRDLLARAVDDIFGQVMDDVEVIIVDDADEADEGREFVAALPEEQARRVHLVSRAGQPHGRWHAANAGLDAARGEFISLHDDDDWWDRDFLARTVEFLDENPEVPAVCSRTMIVVERPDDDGLRQTDAYPFLPELSGISLIDMLRANRIPPISMLYRRSLHEEFGPYDAGLDYLADWAFYLRVVAGHPIALLDEPPLAFWSHRPDSAGDDSNSISAAHQRAATDDAIRDAYLRRGIAQYGMAPFVHTAHETKWLEERLRAHIDETGGSLAERDAGISRQIDLLGRQVQELSRIVEDLHAQLAEVSSAVRRVTTPLGVIARPLRSIRERFRR